VPEERLGTEVGRGDRYRRETRPVTMSAQSVDSRCRSRKLRGEAGAVLSGRAGPPI
jgi:hypothetical protein